VAAPPRSPDVALHPGQGPAALNVGVVVWLASELMFFAGLFGAWFTLRSVADRWPPADVELGGPRAALFTAVLLASSVTMHLAVRAAEGHDRATAVRWLAVTGALGSVFLANQGLEYAALDFGIDTHAYGSIFFLLTGFHGLHVLGGIVFMAVVAGIIAGRSSRAPAPSTVAVCGYYWHFVDAVWIAVFLTVYVLR
jgi:cytochrome c oxidase subunit 3